MYFIVLKVLLLNITWVFKRDERAVVELMYRPTIRVTSCLYREKNKGFACQTSRI